MALATRKEVVFDDEYTDPVTGQWVHERRIRKVPIKGTLDVRERQLVRRSFDNGDRWSRPRRHRHEDDDDNGYGRRRSRSRNGNRDRRIARRRDSSSSSSDSDNDSGRRNRSDGRLAVVRRERARSEQPPAPATAPPPSSSDRALHNESGYLWWSGKSRDDANWAERRLDSSYDGMFAAAAGAAIGAMTAARFSNDDNRTKKTIGAALAGGLAMNAAENWFRVYTEEREERKEEKRERRREKRNDDGRR